MWRKKIFKANALCYPPSINDRLFLLCGGNSWKARLEFEKHPITTLSEKEILMLNQYHRLLCDILDKNDGKFLKEEVNSLLEAFFYQFHNAMNRNFRPKLDSSTSSSANYQMERFLSLLSSSHPKARSVNSYAEKMNISPKYLSSVCKSLTGHTAMDIINQFVLRDIERLLRNPQISIKEIAFGLEFPNLSFFGKYVKQHFGMSPKSYRENLILRNGI